MEISPEKYGLPKRIKLIELDIKTIGIIKLIKSRIIMKDARKVLEMVDVIKSNSDGVTVKLVCTENICSKSKSLLLKNNVDIVYEVL